LRVLNQAFDHPMEFEERAADPLAGGLMHGYQCGMMWGAALAAGAQAYRLFGASPQAETKAIIASQKIVESFRDQNGHINCRDITKIDLSSPSTRTIVRFLIKSLPIGSCFGMAARYAKAAFRDINAILSEKDFETPAAPVSCSVVLAQMRGASELHVIMAAGFAGGIGLSGSACGALGAAIWLIGMDILKDGGKLGLNVPRANEAIERFTKCTDNEFKCSKIVGRKFESIGDHARDLRDGGCSKIIEALAAT
jgi:hypothetical protein